MYSHVSLVWVCGHGGLSLLFWLSGTFNSLSLQQRSQWFVHYQGVEASSVGQFGRATGSRVDWASFFFKKWQISLDNAFLGDSFPAGAKMLGSPTNQIVAWTCGRCTITAILYFPPKLKLHPQLGGACTSSSISPTHWLYWDSPLVLLWFSSGSPLVLLWVLLWSSNQLYEGKLYQD